MSGTNRSPHSTADHVLGRLGVHYVDPADDDVSRAGRAGCAPGLHLHVDPLLFDPDGHLDFGVLGVFLDLASSRSGIDRPFVHADISINRIARPEGDRIDAETRVLRRGKRTMIVHVLATERGRPIADSTQQIAFVGPPRDMFDHGDGTAETRRRDFFGQLDGVCRLDAPLHELIGVERIEQSDGSAAWSMPSRFMSSNGFGGLHGGVAFDLVTEAAAGAARLQSGGPVEAKSALLRYLAPGDVGPFRAVPVVMPQADGAMFVRVEVHDDGHDGRLFLVGEVHLAAAV